MVDNLSSQIFRHILSARQSATQLADTLCYSHKHHHCKATAAHFDCYCNLSGHNIYNAGVLAPPSSPESGPIFGVGLSRVGYPLRPKAPRVRPASDLHRPALIVCKPESLPTRHHNMKISGPDITKVLVAELKALRDRHTQFQTRVKAANKAARARDEEARKQNAILTQRVIELETELKQAKGSLEVCLSAGGEPQANIFS